MSEQALVRAEQAIAIHQGGLGISDVQRVGNILAASGYFQDAREMAQAAVKVMAGQELGIPPVASMMGINIIKGKVALGANMIASRVRAHGYDFIHKQFDNQGCVLQFLGRKGDPDIGHGMVGSRPILGDSSFNDVDAKAAGISSDMYKKYPRNMFFSRAISNGARWYTPEVFAGAPVYTPEELGARVDSEGEVIVDDRKSEAVDLRPEDVSGIHVGQKPQPPAQAQQPPAEPKQTQPQQKQEEKPEEHPAVIAMWSRMNEKFAILKVFKELKDLLYEICGKEAGEGHYRRILALHGCEKSDQFKTYGHARKCAKDMLLETFVLAEQVKRPDNLNVTDEDLPDNMQPPTEDGKLFDTTKEMSYAD